MKSKNPTQCTECIDTNVRFKRDNKLISDKLDITCSYNVYFCEDVHILNRNLNQLKLFTVFVHNYLI